MIKVLHYTPGFLDGGIESRLLDWYRNIDRSKIQFLIIKLNKIDDSANIKEFTMLGGKYYNLPPFNFKTGLILENMIYDIIVKENVNIVHVHDTNSGLFALRAAKRAGVKCRILHSRTTNFLPNERNVLIKKMFMKLAPLYATNFFACSKEAGLWGCGEKNSDNIVIINNGIQDGYYSYDNEVRRLLRKDLKIENKFVIGSVSRLSTQKNIPFLIKVFSDYSKIDDKAILLIVGGGDTSIVTNELLNYPHLKNKVILAGPKKNVWDYYMAMDVFCGTSFYEGFGTTAIEAQASGLPTFLSLGFPKTIEVTNFVKRMDTKSTNEWVNNIKNGKNKRYPEEGLQEVISHGYSAKKVAKDLEKFYLRSLNEKNY